MADRRKDDIVETQYSDFRINALMATLHEGKENAVGRKALACQMNMSDRAVRSLIEKAREEGCLILNQQDGSGYYLPNDMDDIYSQYKQDTSRALSILKRRKHMRKILKEAGYQI